MNNNKENERLYFGIRNMGLRLKNHGGFPQQDRMIQDKRRSLDKAIQYSYQGATIKEMGALTVAPALINPNKLKQSYHHNLVLIYLD